MLKLKVNEILGDHNVDKQMTDSRGDVCIISPGIRAINDFQVAYLMADISDVSGSVIKDLYQSLESLSCKLGSLSQVGRYDMLSSHSPHRDSSAILKV